MFQAAKDLELDSLWVIYPGSQSYSIGERITVLPISEIPSIFAH